MGREMLADLAVQQYNNIASLGVGKRAEGELPTTSDAILLLLLCHECENKQDSGFCTAGGAEKIFY